MSDAETVAGIRGYCRGLLHTSEKELERISVEISYMELKDETTSTEKAYLRIAWKRLAEANKSIRNALRTFS